MASASRRACVRRVAPSIMFGFSTSFMSKASFLLGAQHRHNDLVLDITARRDCSAKPQHRDGLDQVKEFAQVFCCQPCISDVTIRIF